MKYSISNSGDSYFFFNFGLLSFFFLLCFLPIFNKNIFTHFESNITPFFSTFQLQKSHFVIFYIIFYLIENCEKYIITKKQPQNERTEVSLKRRLIFYSFLFYFFVNIVCKFFNNSFHFRNCIFNW